MNATNLDIAKVCHEVNRTYCQAIGDDSQVPWPEAPEWQRVSAMNGVDAVLDGTAASPAVLHESWMAEKVADGWFWGAVKDAVAKTHPCLVEYDALPPEQRVKDHLFLAVVSAMRPDTPAPV